MLKLLHGQAQPIDGDSELHGFFRIQKGLHGERATLQRSDGVHFGMF